MGSSQLEGTMPQAKKAHAVGFNHVAIEVGDIDAALSFFGQLFDFELRSKSETGAFIDLGDQFLALQKAATRQLMTAVMSAVWPMTRKPCARPWPRPVS